MCPDGCAFVLCALGGIEPPRPHGAILITPVAASFALFVRVAQYAPSLGAPAPRFRRRGAPAPPPPARANWRATAEVVGGKGHRLSGLWPRRLFFRLRIDGLRRAGGKAATFAVGFAPRGL